jgi:hypothetical protein
MAVDTFHWVIFGLHLAGALMITFGIWFRCDPDLWVSRMRVDTYELPAGNGSAGLWWQPGNETLAAECGALGQAGQSRRCFSEDLPLYEREPQNLGWHLFALLGHFEWISAAFAFFYIRGGWNRWSWVVSLGMAAVGTVVFMPWRGTVFVNEVLLLLANLAVCAGVFYSYRRVHLYPGPSSGGQPAGELVFAPQQSRSVLRVPKSFALAGNGDLHTDSLRTAELPAMRYAEYCITAAELWVAVLAVFVTDPPAFMTICGYALILLCNLYGALLHYSTVSNYMGNVELTASAGAIPSQAVMLHSHQRTAHRGRRLAVPKTWSSMGPRYEGVPGGDEPSAGTSYLFQRHVWGSYIASNTSTLLNSWLAYAVAIALIFYQQTFLFSGDPPAFVVFSGWSLITTFTSFGLWISVLYSYPAKVGAWCRCLPEWAAPRETYELAVRGLDILSVSAKLSIVGALSFGFVFRADGRC